MSITRVLAASVIAGAAVFTAPASAAVLGDCSDSHDVEVHLTQDQCVQLDWPTA
jgi:hypothetical protein